MTENNEQHDQAMDGFGVEDGAVSKGEMEEQLAAMQTELQDVQSRLLRVSADYQNYVRRSQQNIDNARDIQLIDIAKALLTVVDHFDHALQVDLEKITAASLQQGVQIVHSELLSVLQRFGIERLTVKAGDEFDPNRHEALMRQKAQDLESGTVAAQIQPGYLLHDKIIRPAKVILAE